MYMYITKTNETRDTNLLKQRCYYLLLGIIKQNLFIDILKINEDHNPSLNVEGKS